MIPIPASLRSDFIHIPGTLIHIALESTIHIIGISNLSLSSDDSVLVGNSRYTPLRHAATNALLKGSTATGIPLSPSVPSARQTHLASDCVPATSGFPARDLDNILSDEFRVSTACRVARLHFGESIAKR
jgi:hypothetical protein